MPDMTTAEKAPAGKAVSCFVIGPIGDKFAEHGTNERVIYENSLKVMEEVILPACKQFAIEPIRSDAIAEPGEIPEQVFELLRDVDIVIADLSGGNPNVMYELGLRHTRNLCTISLAETGRMPFDVTVIRTIKFRRSESALIDAREQVAAALGQCLQGNHRPVTATRLWAELYTPGDGPGSRPRAHDTDQEQRSVDDEEEEEASFFLERLAEMEEALPRLLELIGEINATMGDIASIFTIAQARIEDLNTQGKGTVTTRLAVARQVGGDLEGSATRLENVANSWETELARADLGMSAMIEAVEAEPHRLNELGELPSTVEGAVHQMREAMAAGDEMANVVASLASIARPLSKPSKRIATSIRRVSKASAIFQVWGARLQRLIIEGDTAKG